MNMSPDETLGRNGQEEAEAGRQEIISDLNAWKSFVLVIDGDFSDELPEYPDFDKAIRDALKRAKAKDLLAMRVYGDDSNSPNQNDAARKFIKDMKLDPKKWDISLTGAWVDGRTGCVVGVRNVFKGYGFKTKILNSALVLP